MMPGYNETIRKFAADDRRVGILEKAQGTGEVGLSAGEAGRKLAVRFTIACRDRVVEKVRFQAFGCGFTIAACAAAAELAEGHTLNEVQKIRPAWVDALLEGLPAERRYCADLAVQALQAALASYQDRHPVQTSISAPQEEPQHPSLTADDPLYLSLMESTAPPGISAADRHLFACLLTTARRETRNIAAALGLTEEELAALLNCCFPAFDPRQWVAPKTLPESNSEMRALLLSHVPKDRTGTPRQLSRWLALVLAARAAHPGHLWVAMGLFQRLELSATIARHLPTLAAANDKGMRWKRYLFREVCKLNGGLLCKSPNCGQCSDYVLCFGSD